MHVLLLNSISSCFRSRLDSKRIGSQLNLSRSRDVIGHVTILIDHFLLMVLRRVYVSAVRLAWTNVDVSIAADRRSSDGQKLLVIKEQSDLRIVCEATADDVEWRVNVHTTLTAGVDGVEMSQHSATVDGKLRTMHTLSIRNASVADTGTYSCHIGAVSDHVNVIIIRLASTCPFEIQH